MKSYMLLAILSFGLSTTAAAFENPDGPEQEKLEQESMQHCERNQLSMNVCSYRAYKDGDAELNDLYKKQMARLEGTAHADRLRNAQRAWLKYIEADCLYQNGPIEESGTIWPLLQNRCLLSHMTQRIVLLQEFAECTDNGCPGQ